MIKKNFMYLFIFDDAKMWLSQISETTLGWLVCANTALYSGDKNRCHAILPMNISRVTSILSLLRLVRRQTQQLALKLWRATDKDNWEEDVFQHDPIIML